MHGVPHRQRQFEPGTAGGIVVVLVVAVESPRLDDRDQVPVAVVDADLVKALFAEVHEAEFETVIGHRACMPRKVRLYEGDRGRLEFAIVNAYAKDAVADDGIFVRVDIRRFEFGEAECLVPKQ